MRACVRCVRVCVCVCVCAVAPRTPHAAHVRARSKRRLHTYEHAASAACTHTSTQQAPPGSYVRSVRRAVCGVWRAVCSHGRLRARWARRGVWHWPLRRTHHPTPHSPGSVSYTRSEPSWHPTSTCWCVPPREGTHTADDARKAHRGSSGSTSYTADAIAAVGAWRWWRGRGGGGGGAADPHPHYLLHTHTHRRAPPARLRATAPTEQHTRH